MGNRVTRRLGRTPTPAITKSSLTPACRRLVELMQHVNFGRIEGLEVAGGEPVLAPAPRVVREVKFGADNGPRAERAASDFKLRAPVRELLVHLALLRDGCVESIEIRHGLPFRMTVEDIARA